MAQDIYDPLEEYEHVFRDRFEQVARDTFAQLAAEAKVDVEANRDTCQRLSEATQKLSSVESRRSLAIALCLVLWAVVVGGGVAAYLCHGEWETWQLNLDITAVVLSVVVLFAKVHPRISNLSDQRDELKGTVDSLTQEAWQQMEPLNRLYDWDVLTRMMSKTVPRLEFDPYFTTQRLADLSRTYGWDGSFNEQRSVVYSHSGLINGNPFVLCRTRKMEMGAKTYYGSIVITWETEETDSEGNTHTVYHSETLTASVTAPYPEYYEKTRLIYGNTAAPDLVFHRRQSGLADKVGSLSFKLKKRHLKAKARDLSGADYAMLTNDDFEVAFDTSDRNNNQQFALLFTPLAQNSMMKLLQDHQVGYGDDFDFDKEKMINTVTPGHMQAIDLDADPRQYRQYDYDKAEHDFIETNARYFRAIYFSLAPLLCVPMYQQIRPAEAIYGHDMPHHSAFWEHEALANFWGQDHFKAPSCVTNCILKTEEEGHDGDTATIRVYAHGYRVEQRVSFISKWGGDDQFHDVPVYWDEYLPVTGTGTMQIQEDNTPEDQGQTPHQRFSHIADVLQKAGLDVYRRHIASSCN